MRLSHDKSKLRNRSLKRTRENTQKLRMEIDRANSTFKSAFHNGYLKFKSVNENR